MRQRFCACGSVSFCFSRVLISVSSAIFRQLASGGEAQRPDRLFRAAVSAFASLTRPTRREITQLDDLALPLFEHVRVETRRYAAAVLCECASPPPGLLRKLSNEPVAISAPLLVRSQAFADTDLIGLIARHGLSHARVIARRADLNPAITALIRALSAQTDGASPVTFARSAAEGIGALEEGVRNRLRHMVRAANASGTVRDRNTALVDAARSNSIEAFATILAGRLAIPLALAMDIAGDQASSERLMIALRALGLEDAEAYLMTATLHRDRVLDRITIQRFVERYRAIRHETVQAQLGFWRRLREDPNQPGSRELGLVQPAATSK
ncbi:hypothetical protein NA8A_19780 [Nitratireductor indicus C115]|uniref:DUF2336 domain-containing protein n=1 Tax=Nitratireductor indicus C115 TaxID=1231190 RepID=K2MZI4_9HYPH|nr:hypothetical protein NA8A_19780 [Nitratireductor indicus C115]SFQ43718.1 Uncharacterized conserved protein, DUF2336 family [Nitratireductor indicus]